MLPICFQSLVVSGNKDSLAPFASKFLASWHNYDENSDEGQYEFLRTFVPIPDDIYVGSSNYDVLEASELREKGEDLDKLTTEWTKKQLVRAKKKYGKYRWHWYFWCLGNWGNLFEDHYTTVDENDEVHIKLSFETPLVPIKKGILNISKDYPSLNFSIIYFYEEFVYPAGEANIENGEILSEREDSEEVREMKVTELYEELKNTVNDESSSMEDQVKEDQVMENQDDEELPF